LLFPRGVVCYHSPRMTAIRQSMIRKSVVRFSDEIMLKQETLG